jgi:cytochrome c oxidase subunit 1
MPLTLGLFANALIPYLLGVLDLVFPRVNNFSFWVLPVALGAITSAVAIGEGTGLG